jgi:hypothetical protein
MACDRRKKITKFRVNGIKYGYGDCNAVHFFHCVMFLE